MQVSIAPSLVAMSKVCSIIGWLSRAKFSATQFHGGPARQVADIRHYRGG
jgi:hypothetical protein